MDYSDLACRWLDVANQLDTLAAWMRECARECGRQSLEADAQEGREALAALEGGGEPDRRCPTCQQRGSRVHSYERENGGTITWYCNVPGCENGFAVARERDDLAALEGVEANASGDRCGDPRPDGAVRCCSRRDEGTCGAARSVVGPHGDRPCFHFIPNSASDRNDPSNTKTEDPNAL
jgi:hypothetical protein